VPSGLLVWGRFLVTPLFTTDDFTAHPSLSQETLTLLQQFEDIFQTPPGLPPQRTHDHAIVLRENAEVPNIKALSVSSVPKG